MIEVRVAQPDDADAIAAAHIEGWRVGYRHVFPTEFLDADEFATSRLDRWRGWTWNSRGDSQLFVVLRGGRVVGFGHVGPARVEPVCDESGNGSAAETTGAKGEIYGFYVHPEAWGCGAASALIARCHEYLRDEGFNEAVLWVLRDNPRARVFYEKAGWFATGREMMFEPQNTGPVPEVEYTVHL
ncbi:MAG: GNAT family N-acetyltransferase [Actinobacteria bacterium]|nr:GNAT family N-acetyltransferase [Actinomycetota bacterium]